VRLSEVDISHVYLVLGRRKARVRTSRATSRISGEKEKELCVVRKKLRGLVGFIYPDCSNAVLHKPHA
jgi:hypothetical protein